MGSDAQGKKEWKRGALWMILARLGFLGGSYGLYFLLERLGGRALFADYKAVVAWVSVAATVVRQGATQMVARFVAACPGAERLVRRRALGMLVVIGFAVTAALALIGTFLAGELGTPLYLAAWIALAYAIAAVWNGSLNGQRRLVAQGRLDLLAIGLKVALVAGGAWWFQTTAGAVGGFLLASVIAALAGAWIVQRAPGGGSGEAPSPRTMGRFLSNSALFMLALQWTVQMDLWYLRWWSTGAASSPDAQALYAGFQLFCQIPYALVAAVVFLAFPLIAGGGGVRGKEDPSAVLRESLRATFLVAALVLGGVQLQPVAAIGLLFPADAARLMASEEGSRAALAALGAAYFGLSVLFVVGSSLNAWGRPRASVWMSVTALVVQCACAFWWTPRYGIFGTAAATAVGQIAGAILGLWMARRLFDLALPWGTLARSLVGLGALLTVGALWPGEGFWTLLLRSIVAALVYLGVLLVLGERWKSGRPRQQRVST